jgi:hypothetical protein
MILQITNIPEEKFPALELDILKILGRYEFDTNMISIDDALTRKFVGFELKITKIKKEVR